MDSYHVRFNLFEIRITVNLKGIEMKFNNKYFRAFRIIFSIILLLSVVSFAANGSDCFIDSIRVPVVKYCPASTDNFSLNTRTPAEINYIVIHTVQGSLGSAVRTFGSDDLSYPRSAHYTIGKDGEVIKSVRARKEAWHAGTSPLGSGGKYESRVLNENSIGIEHAGFVDDPNFPTQDQYLASAALTRYLAELYEVPLDRNHIVGHEEIKSAKGDPGPNWDWDYYMDLVRNGYRGRVGQAAEEGDDLQEVRKSGGFTSGLVLIGAAVAVLGYLYG